MSEEEPVTTSESSQSFFAHLLKGWVRYRRLIIVGIIALTLAAFLTSVSVQTRVEIGHGLWEHQGVILLLLIFSLLILSLLWSAGQRLDAWFFTLLNVRGYHPMWLDRVTWAFTQLGNGVLGIFAAITLYFANLRRLALDLIFGILSLWLMVEMIKALVDRRRPFIALENTRVVGWREPGLSFPSGHTAQTFFMAALLSQYFQAGVLLSLFLYGIALIVGFTRIYVGAHYPRDVIGGAILGSVWGTVSGIIQAYIITGKF